MPQVDQGLLEHLRWRRRLIIVFADDAPASKAQWQQRLLHKAGGGWQARDLVVVTARGDVVEIDGMTVEGLEPAPLRRQYEVERGFQIILVGKDGGVKFRADAPVSAEQLFARIDVMPMRRREIRERDRGVILA